MVNIYPLVKNVPLLPSFFVNHPAYFMPRNLLIKRGFFFEWSPTGKARGTSMFFGGIRRSIPSYAQGFGGLSSLHSSTAIGRACTPKLVTARRRGLLRRRIKRTAN